MTHSTISALSPLDGRYAARVAPLEPTIESDDGQPFRTEVTLLPETRIIEWGGQRVETLVSQYTAYLGGRIHEVAYDFAGVDMVEEPVPIRPGQHYIMGGIKTDVDTRAWDVTGSARMAEWRRRNRRH